MANEKRQRQDLARAQKLAREAQDKAQAIRKARIRQFVLIGAVLAVAVAALLFITKDSSKSSDQQSTAGAPTVTVGSGAAPTKLETKDLKVGTGETVQKGDTVRVKYTGVAWSTKEQFDSNWDDETSVFTVTGVGTDQRNVIEGWDGLVGAKVGGRRQLVIPPALGYGAAGAGEKIGANETLVFVVDILSREQG